MSFFSCHTSMFCQAKSSVKTQATLTEHDVQDISKSWQDIRIHRCIAHWAFQPPREPLRLFLHVLLQASCVFLQPEPHLLNVNYISLHRHQCLLGWLNWNQFLQFKGQQSITTYPPGFCSNYLLSSKWALSTEPLP